MDGNGNSCWMMNENGNNCGIQMGAGMGMGMKIFCDLIDTTFFLIFAVTIQ
jgi:hypothetical protein